MFTINKKYNYFNMCILYLKLVPLIGISKIIYNIVKSIIPTFMIIITAMFINNAIGVVNHSNDLVSVIIPFFVIIAIKLFNCYAGIGIDLLSTRASNKIQQIVTPALVEKKASVKFKYYEHQDSIDIMNRAMGDFIKNIQSFIDIFFNAWNIVFQIVGFVVILGMQLWWAAIVFFITFIPSFIVSYRYGQKSYDMEKDMSKINRKVGYISEILTGRDSLEERYIYGYTSKLNEEYKNKYEYKRITRKKVSKSLWVNTTFASMLTFVSGIIVIAILIPSAIFPNENGITTLTVGGLVAITNAILGLSDLHESISDNFYDFKYKLEYLKDLNTFLKFEECKDACVLPDSHTFSLNSIEFKNVSFQYPGCEPFILKNVNIKLHSGKHYAIVGANGSGKTTFVKILTGLYDNYEGDILINGKDLRTYTMSELKALSAIVYQDFNRYPLDFYHNIAIGNINDIKNREKVEKAVAIIGLSEAVNKLPNGLETPITKIKESGVDMSGGEWQRIALARLLVNPAPLKILDEPTAALDPISESRVYEQFGNIINHNKDNAAITIFISHRLGSTKLADEIIVLSEGQVAETGTFDELISSSGIYTEMYKTQSEWYREKE